MRYTLLVLSPPDLGVSNRHALQFARALQRAGHVLHCVFFYDAGALTGLSGAEASQDEDDLRAGWQQLAQDGDIDLKVCIASAARFGTQDREDERRLLPGFSIVGLGDLVEAQTGAERLLSFAD